MSLRSEAENRANAAFIMQACNTHSKLTEAARQAREFLVEEYDAMLNTTCLKYNGEPDRKSIDAEFEELAQRYEKTIAAIDAALLEGKA